ncbi:MAG TPA: DUF2007 domain-containing protein [Firmicutes bacterium]|nr:hypothetical protein [Bacillota bacterium]HHY99102.1 DUF2007 domain-containing protein [Bacillota bacterium]
MVDERWAELCQVSSEIEGEVIRSFLLAQDIQVILKTGLPPGVYPGLTPIKVFVPQKDLEAARRALEEIERG